MDGINQTSSFPFSILQSHFRITVIHLVLSHRGSQRRDHNQRLCRSVDNQNSTIAAAAATTPATLCFTWVASPVNTGGAAAPVWVCPCVVDEVDEVDVLCADEAALIGEPGPKPPVDDSVGSVIDPVFDGASVTTPVPDDDMVLAGGEPELDAVSAELVAVAVGVAPSTGGIEMAWPAEAHCSITTLDTAGKL